MPQNTKKKLRRVKIKGEYMYIPDGFTCYTYIEMNCPLCDVVNKIYLGNLQDLSKSDIDGFRCYGCHNVFLLMDDDVMLDMLKKQDSAYIEDGEKPKR
jgi:hypothetical protein